MSQTEEQRPLDRRVDQTGQSSRLLECQDREQQHLCTEELIPWHCRNERTFLFSCSASACPAND